MPTVRISRKGASRIASGHPWIFSSDVLDRGQAAAGDAVTVVGPSGGALGTAHYSEASQISLRMLSERVEAIDRAFFRQRIAAAEAHRKRVVADSEAYRLVHGEADELPGLVIDRYGDYFTLQTLDQGMDRAKSDIVGVLEELFAPRGIVERNDVAIRKREALPLVSGVVAGEAPETVALRMNGLKLHADLLHGQKTGIFLDQRENYLAAARYGRGRALDCFTSTGGFALHLAARCESVEAIDSGEAALRVAKMNCEANGIANVELREADVFDLLGGYASARRRFDLVVLDPPAFAKSRQALDAAVRGYGEINRRALQLLDPGGVLVTCSCSHHLSEAELLEVVAKASLDTGRKLRVLERRMQAQDHPVLLTVPETLYLKCLILEVI
ncbi:MAG TPA: class I SAM-dependent rRNA methyltransferase [Bryobacteraceae bacterium]|nr:class I SAM-dependent rRNA methyltransferase [Bryobacteraceae bacterium]